MPMWNRSPLAEKGNCTRAGVRISPGADEFAESSSVRGEKRAKDATPWAGGTCSRWSDSVNPSGRVVFVPKGRRTIAQGASPGEQGEQYEKPRRGDTTRRGVSPLRGFNSFSIA